jgi:hypothetical protein
MHGAVLAFVALACVIACSASKGPPPLPKRLAVTAPESTSPPQPIAFRTSGGTPIAPVVIADDPAPAVVPSAQEHLNVPGSTLNGDPKGLSREVLNRALQGAVASVASCFSSSSQAPMVAISFEADPSGRPSLVRVTGAQSDAEHCIRNVIQDVRFPSFEGKGVQVDFPVTFHRVARAAQSGSPSGEEQTPGASPSGPPLFMAP